MPNVYKALGQTSATAKQVNEYWNAFKDPSFESYNGVNNFSGNTWTSVPGTTSWNLYCTQLETYATGGAAGGFGNKSFGFTTPNYNVWIDFYLSYGGRNAGTLDTSNAFPVVPGTTYYWGYYFYYSLNQNYSTHQANITWYAADGTVISTQTWNQSAPSVNTWTRHTFTTDPAPANAAYASAWVYERFYHSSGNQAFYYDNFHFSSIASTNTTFPGMADNTNLTLTQPFNARLYKTWEGTTLLSRLYNTFAGVPVAAYTVPSGKQAIVSTINVANLSTSAQTYRIAHVPSGETLAKKHWIAFDIPVPANSTDPWTTGISMNSGDILYVSSDSADMSFTAHGTEITP